ncbi:glutamate racemase [Desulfolucanica intricata]|uniref:glutamate racemase n=1 Tax=Desulfolucanica intricata TaxID=1285191 RepID=UPI00083747A9|nr:glutamate racemase [Desulfolucanica intricata]
MTNPAPIGFFDSGVGGLSIMNEVRRLLPKENMIYFADSAYCPYGVKPPNVIRARCINICDFLIEQGVKLIVVASNTTSVAGLDILRQRYTVPIVGVEPAIKPAAEKSRSGKIGIMATEVTLSGERFASLVRRFGSGVEVYTQPCPGLVELVEEGKLEGPETKSLLNRYLNPILAQGSDTIVLGCTHYPFLRSTILELVGPEIMILDTGEAVARQVNRIINRYELTTSATKGGWVKFFTSGDAEKATKVIQYLWKDKNIKVKHISLNT